MRDNSGGFPKKPSWKTSMRAVAAGLLLVGGAVSCAGEPAATASADEANLPASEVRADSFGRLRPPHRPERYLYVATISKSGSDPDFVTVVGANPRYSDFGKIVNRIDMPKIGDELHHFGYSWDQERLIVPGLFSNRIHVFEIGRDRKSMRLLSMNDQLTAESGYIIPHSVIATPYGRSVVTMIGAASGTTQPGGLVEIDDETGTFATFFGPGPARGAGNLAPRYMYDFASALDGSRGISTTFGPPGLCGGGIEPTCLGDEVAVWDVRNRRVIQVANLGAHSGALEVRFIDSPGIRRAFINTPGTSAVWLAHDDNRDGFFEFRQVLGPSDGLVLPVDMLLSYDHRYMYLTNWFGNTVQQFDIRDPFHPVLKATVSVPHPNMLRLSPDGRRLYVSNSLLTTWDDDPRFGPPRNDSYGIWLFYVDEKSGGLSPSTGNGSPWVSFTNVRKRNTVGPAGPHMMFFDPGVRLLPGEH